MPLTGDKLKMKCILVAFCLISIAQGGVISGSYLPGIPTDPLFRGSLETASYGTSGAGGFSYSGSDTFAHGGGVSLHGDETSFFPTISHDAQSFEHGDFLQTQPGQTNEVHFYGGPNSGEKTRLRIRVGAAPRRTSVLYVKSPDAGSVIPEIVAPRTPSVDKTVVYVLSKNQEQHGSITIPSSVTHNVVKSKPEVYYLKYNNQHDAERAVSESLGGRAAGASVQYVNNKDSFVRTLDDGFRGVGVGGGFSSHGVSLGGLGGSGFAQGGFGSYGSRYGVPGASGPY